MFFAFCKCLLLGNMQKPQYKMTTLNKLCVAFQKGAENVIECFAEGQELYLSF